VRFTWNARTVPLPEIGPDEISVTVLAAHGAHTSPLTAIDGAFTVRVWLAPTLSAQSVTAALPAELSKLRLGVLAPVSVPLHSLSTVVSPARHLVMQTLRPMAQFCLTFTFTVDGAAKMIFS